LSGQSDAGTEATKIDDTGFAGIYWKVNVGIVLGLCVMVVLIIAAYMVLSSGLPCDLRVKLRRRSTATPSAAHTVRSKTGHHLGTWSAPQHLPTNSAPSPSIGLVIKRRLLEKPMKMKVQFGAQGSLYDLPVMRSSFREDGNSCIRGK